MTCPHTVTAYQSRSVGPVILGLELAEARRGGLHEQETSAHGGACGWIYESLECVCSTCMWLCVNGCEEVTH